jgi:endonuclease/exonuclease/phosphatase family metal-dependent hydrolase
MQVLIHLVSFWLISAGAFCQSEESFKVMTYNIRLDYAGDNEDNWYSRKSDMASFLMLVNADFIGIQEALNHQVTYLDSMLFDYKYIGVGRDDGAEAGEYMALFYKVNKWDLLKNNTFWLSETPEQPGLGWDSACNRVCTHGTFRHKKSGKIVHISNTHLDHEGQEARKNSILLLRKHINSIKKDNPIVLMGDFNFTPDDQLYTDLTSFIDDSRMLSTNIDVSSEGTYNGFRLDGHFPKRIDYILVDSISLKVNKYIVPIPKTELSRHVSDHFPVIIEITFND